MARKSRYPYRDLGFTDYLTWIKGFAKWFGDQEGKPDYPTHLGDGLEEAIEDYHKAVNNWERLKSLRGGKYKIVSGAFKALRKQIVRIRIALPTIAPDSHVLADFGISKAASQDHDILCVDAEICVNHWNELCDPDPPAQFEPVRFYFEKLAELLDNHANAKRAYGEVMFDALAAQNELVRARKACDVIERRIFRWYRACYPDTKDEFWTATDWGASRGRRGRPKKVEK